MNLNQHTYTKRSEKINDFTIGFVVWSGLNLMAGWTLASTSLLYPDFSAFNLNAPNPITYLIVGLNCLVLLLNIGALIYFGFTRYWIALGILVAFAVSLLVVLLIGLMLNVLCYMVPAWILGKP
jgi:hypothetical protein